MNDKKAIRHAINIEQQNHFIVLIIAHVTGQNVAVIQNSKSETFHVGLDCAQTLSGITDFDIDS